MKVEALAGMLTEYLDVKQAETHPDKSVRLQFSTLTVKSVAIGQRYKDARLAD